MVDVMLEHLQNYGSERMVQTYQALETPALSMVMPPVPRIETAVRLGTNGNFLQRADKNASVWTKVTGSELGREKMCLPKFRGPAAPMPHELAPTHEESCVMCM